MNEHDLFTILADKKEKTALTLRRSFADFTGGILLTICILLTAVYPLVALRLINPLSPEFFVNTAYTGISSYLAYLLFFPEGKRAESSRNSLFIEGETRLLALSFPVKSAHLAAFTTFCQRRSEEELSEKKQRFLEKHGFFGEGENRPSERKKARLVRRAERLRLAPIEPSLILCKEGDMKLSGVGRPQLSYGRRAALLRPPMLLLSSLLFSSIAILPGGGIGFAVLVKILSGVFGVTMAAFAGYSAGCSDIRWQSGLTERKLLFLASFYQEAGIPLPEESK